MYNYEKLSNEQREQMIKANIPKFEVTGTFEMTEEDKEKAGADLHRLVKEFEENRKRK